MKTRQIKKMEALQQLVDDLTSQLEAQRLRLANLEERRASGGNYNNPFPLSQPSAPATTSRFDASRIPDAIKMIVPYRGDSKDKKSLATWINSVEGKLEFARNLLPEEADIEQIMPLWVGIIRDRIVEEASDALASRNNPETWEEIKQVLVEYFGDKRDLCTLVTQISYLRQGTKSIVEFYNECRELLSDITAKLLLDKETKPCVKVLTKSYEDMILNSFVDGLIEPYSTLTRTSRPNTLLSAFQGALDQYNATQRRKEKFPKPATPPQKPVGYGNFKPSYSYPRPAQPQNPQFQRQFPPFQRQPPPNFPYQRPPFQNTQYQRPFQQNPQFQKAIAPYIKPDPSGQSKQLVPFQRREAQVNNCETTPYENFDQFLEQTQDICAPEQNYETTVMPNDINETHDELNFCMDPDKQITE